MSKAGYCPHCHKKIIDVRVLNMFDDFTIKCPCCLKLVQIVDVDFKEREIVDKKKK